MFKLSLKNSFPGSFFPLRNTENKKIPQPLSQLRDSEIQVFYYYFLATKVRIVA